HRIRPRCAETQPVSVQDRARARPDTLDSVDRDTAAKEPLNAFPLLCDPRARANPGAEALRAIPTAPGRLRFGFVRDRERSARPVVRAVPGNMSRAIVVTLGVERHGR